MQICIFVYVLHSSPEKSNEVRTGWTGRREDSLCHSKLGPTWWPEHSAGWGAGRSATALPACSCVGRRSSETATLPSRTSGAEKLTVIEAGGDSDDNPSIHGVQQQEQLWWTLKGCVKPPAPAFCWLFHVNDRNKRLIVGHGWRLSYGGNVRTDGCFKMFFKHFLNNTFFFIKIYFRATQRNIFIVFTYKGSTCCSTGRKYQFCTI